MVGMMQSDYMLIRKNVESLYIPMKVVLSKPVYIYPLLYFWSKYSPPIILVVDLDKISWILLIISNSPHIYFKVGSSY